MFESLTNRLRGAFDGLRGARTLTEDNVEQGLRQVRQALLEADVHFQVARDFVERVKQRALGEALLGAEGVRPSDQFVHAVHQELVELLGPEDARIEFAKDGPTVVLLAGLQGAGKTTTCAKLARRLRDKEGRRPLLVAADVKRPAAVEQLRVLGAQLGVPVYHEPGLDPPELCARGVAEAKRQGCDLVLLDTAGRLHVDDALMAEVGEIARRTKPHAQVLVVDAMTGQDALRSAQAFHERLALTGVILTKLDGDARGGAVLSLKEVTGAPVLFLGTGERVEDLDAFSAERMAGRVLGMGDVVGLVEAAQDQLDERDAQAAYEQLVMGRFTLEDLLAQLGLIQKLPMKKMLGMLPGVGSQLGDLDLDDKQFKRIEALCTSMTRRERLQPELIDVSRRRRIAKGAGQDSSAVSQLLKMHKQMAKLMKQMPQLAGLGGAGSKAKRQALEALSADGELAADLGGDGLLSRLGGAAKGMGGAAKGLGALLGLGGGGLPGGLDPEALQRQLAGGGRKGPDPAAAAKRKAKERAKQKQARKQRKKR